MAMKAEAPKINYSAEEVVAKLASLVQEGKHNEAIKLYFDEIRGRRLMERLVVQAAYKQKLEEVRGRGRGISSVSSLGEVTEQQVPIVVSAPSASRRFKKKVVISSVFMESDAKKLVQLYETLKQHSLINVDIYTVLFPCLCMCGDTLQVQGIAEDIRRFNIQLPTNVWEVAISILLGREKFNNADLVVREMKALGVPITEEVFHLFIQYHCNADNAKEAVQVFNEMIESGLKGSVVTYTALLRLLKRQKKLRDAMSLWDLMKNSHITPQLSTFNTMMDILVDFVDIEGALDVYDEMRQAGIEPNQSTHVILGKVIHDW